MKFKTNDIKKKFAAPLIFAGLFAGAAVLRSHAKPPAAVVAGRNEMQELLKVVTENTYHRLSEGELRATIAAKLGPEVATAVLANTASAMQYQQAVDTIVSKLNSLSDVKIYEDTKSYELVYEQDNASLRERIEFDAVVGIGIRLGHHSRVDETGQPDTEASVVEQIVSEQTRLAGLSVGDRIVKVDGIDALDLKQNADITDFIRGREGTVVNLTVRKMDGSTRELSVVRRTLPPLPTITLNGVYNGVVVLKVDTFRSSTVQEFYNLATIAEMFGVRGYVFDLRGCGGGDSDAAVDISRYFAGKGDILLQWSKTSDGRDPMVVVHAEEDGRLRRYPVGVLVNQETYGSAEHFADYMSALARPIFGKATKGLGKIKGYAQLSDSLALSYESSHILKPDGRLLDGVGVSPSTDANDDDHLAVFAANFLVEKNG